MNKIITLDDIFRNLETEEKAFKFLRYVKDMQEEIEILKDDNKYLNKVNIELSSEKNQLNSIIKEVREYIQTHIRIDDEYPNYMEMLLEEYNKLLEILDKEMLKKNENLCI